MRKDVKVILFIVLVPVFIMLVISLLHPFFKSEDVALFKAKNDMEIIQKAIEKYKQDIGRMPNKKEGLLALTDNPGIKSWKGPYLKNEQLVDPWNITYNYSVLEANSAEVEYFLISFGKNKKRETNGENLSQEKALGDDIVVKIK